MTLDSISISVVITNYNYAAYLPRAVASISRDRNIELILVDDGSTDESRTVIKQIESSRPDLITLFKENGGAASARNRGADACSNDYILFLDADDELTENAIPTFRKAITAVPDAAAIISGTVHVSDLRKKVVHQKALREENHQRFSDFLAGRFEVAQGSSIFKKSVLNDIRFPEHLRRREDVPFIAKVLATRETHSIPDATVKHYSHPNSKRHEIASLVAECDDLVDDLFDANLLTPQMMKLKTWYQSLQYLEIFRTLYLNNRTKEAKKFYHKAVRTYPGNIRRWSFFKKYLRTFAPFLIRNAAPRA